MSCMSGMIAGARVCEGGRERGGRGDRAVKEQERDRERGERKDREKRSHRE